MIFRKESYHNKLVYIQNEFIENQNGLNFNSNFEGGNLLKGKDTKINCFHRSNHSTRFQKNINKKHFGIRITNMISG